MADTGISNAAAKASADAVVDLLDAGAGAAYVEIRTGTPPAGGPDAAATGTLLGTLTCNDPSFGAAVDATPGGQATANAITDDSSADASGDAGWFRGYDSDANAVIDGDITAAAGGGDMTVAAIAVVAGNVIAITGWTVTQSEG